MSFLPNDYKPPKGGRYMKLQDGLNKFRILSDAIVGWEYWNNQGKPVRSREYPNNTPDIRVKDDGTKEKPKHFWAFVVWDYAAKEVKILEITQNGIQNDITNLFNNPEWGDPKNYDLGVTRSGSGFDTTYSTMPSPVKDLPLEVANAYSQETINLAALYDGGDPFAGGAEEEVQAEDIKID